MQVKRRKFNKFEKIHTHTHTHTHTHRHTHIDKFKRMMEIMDECIDEKIFIEKISINAACEQFRPDHEQFWAELFRVQEAHESDQNQFYDRLLNENDDLKQRLSTLEEKISELDGLKQKLSTLEEKIAHLNKTKEVSLLFLAVFLKDF